MATSLENKTDPSPDTTSLLPNKPNWLKWLPGTLAILVLIAYPLLNRSDTFGIGLLTETLIFGLFALSLNLLMGYTGLTSFGHAAYFGLGAYLAAILARQTQNGNIMLALVVALVVVSLVALVLGYLCIRTSGIYFLMLTLAFSQLLYAAVFKWSDITGGSDGLSVRKPELSLPGLEIDLTDRVNYYFVVLAVFLLGFFILRQIINSSFGKTLVGIRENESRLTALGYNTATFKLTAFVIAGALAGVAGVLHAFFTRLVTASELNWTTSGLVITMVLLGGKGTLVGPVLGALFIRYAELTIQQQTAQIGTFVFSDRWLMVLGIIFVGFIIFAPEGLVGLGRKLVARLTTQKPPEGN